MTYVPELHTLSDTLRHHSTTRPDRVAVLTPGGTQRTYAELADVSSRVASGLRALGVGEGSRVAFIGREDLSYWDTLFACVSLGAVLVPGDWRLTPPEIRHILDDSGADLLVIDSDHPMAGHSGITELTCDAATWQDWWSTHPPLEDPVTPTPDTPMAQLYTSGTTGQPKGVVLAHRSWFAVRRALSEAGRDWITFEEGDVCYVGIAGFHVGGMWFATQTFNAGQTVVSVPEFRADLARGHFRDLGVTNAILVPAMLSAMAALSPSDPEDFAALRQVIYGGAPISESELETCIEVFDCRFAQIYGLTETGNTACCLPPEEHYPGSPRLKASGHPYPTFEARAVDAQGKVLGTGEIGEIHLRTPARMIEYWGRPEATAETLVDGWIRTGDAGYIDEEGYVFIQDRYKDMVLVGGENVFPAEVEKAITAHPAVADVAVIGVPDDRSGEAVLAFVEVAEGNSVTTRDLQFFLRDRLTAFKRPTRWEFIASVPRNPSGKILRRELRDRFWAGRERQVN